jgi:hypothetical protein
MASLDCSIAFLSLGTTRVLRKDVGNKKGAGEVGNRTERWATVLSAGFALVMLLTTQPGIASQYAPGVMQRTIAVRQAGRTAHHLPQELPEVDGYGAHPLPELIGEIVWVRPEGHDRWYSILIVDTANHADGGLAFQAYGRSRRLSHTQGEWVRAQIRAGTLIPRIPLEIDYELARAWNTVGRGIRIEVAYTPPADAMPEEAAPDG